MAPHKRRIRIRWFWGDIKTALLIGIIIGFALGLWVAHV